MRVVAISLVLIAVVAITSVVGINVAKSVGKQGSPFDTKDYKICSLQCEIDYPNHRPETPEEMSHDFRIEARNYKRYCRNMCRNEATRTRAEALLESLIEE